MDLFQDQNESRDCIKESQYLALGMYLEFYVYLAVSVSYWTSISSKKSLIFAY